MLVSIIVNNYNYARYLREAIDSALAQTWRPLEVVVVDDGSTDDSWALIRSYGERVNAIRQVNGGQGSAFNTGLAASRGQWVLFLDSDDVLDADAVQRMMQLANADVAKVQGYLRLIGATGEPLGGAVPYIAHDGDVTPIARRFRLYAAPPSSGNLFQRSAIEPYFPMPTAPWRYSADTVTVLLSAFHGRVATLRGAMGSYRLHSTASQRLGVLGNANRSPATALLRTEQRRREVEEWGRRCTGIVWPDEALMLPWDWRTRALSWRLQREEHPHQRDSRLSILRGLEESLAHWPGYTAVERMMQRGWVAFMLLAPRWCVAALASSNVPGGWRSRLRHLRGARAS